jgi:hypothetical protein
VTRPGLPDWHNVPKWWKIYQIAAKFTKWPWNVTNGRNIFQMAIEYNNLFHSETLQNLHKLGFFKFKIWQPWEFPDKISLEWFICRTGLRDFVGFTSIKVVVLIKRTSKSVVLIKRTSKSLQH